MKLFDKYFQPYAEYCLRTTLSEDELKETLAKECPATSDVLSWKAIKAAMGLCKPWSFLTRIISLFHRKLLLVLMDRKISF